MTTSHTPPGPHPSYSHAGYPPPKKRRKWPWILGGLILLIILISALSGGGGNSAAPSAGAPAAPAAQQPADTASGDVVVYEVTGSGSANNVTYSKQGGQEQASNVDLPWRKEVRFDGGAFSFNPLTIIAQNGGSGDITCKITKNGAVVIESTSSGQYALVTCNGT